MSHFQCQSPVLEQVIKLILSRTYKRRINKEQRLSNQKSITFVSCLITEKKNTSKAELLYYKLEKS